MRHLLITLVAISISLALWVAIRRARGARSEAFPIVEETAPTSLECRDREPFPLETHLMDGNGFPILDWHALDAWARGSDGVERGRRAWLLHFREVLGNGAALLETSDAWVLSSYEPNVARSIGVYVGATRRRITRLLEGIAQFHAAERSIFVAFDSRDHYYHYVANYYPEEGEFAFSGGMYINAGCPHFVTPKEELWILEPTITHEMTHSALAHLKLPLWLDEGIAVTTEQQLAPRYRNPQDALEVIGKHREFWNAERVQEFWSGESFQRTDEGNELSYDLARNIVALIGRDWSSFARFVRGTKHEDAGAAAATAELKLELGDLAAAALNMAPQRGWSPDPATWKHAARRR